MAARRDGAGMYREKRRARRGAVRALSVVGGLALFVAAGITTAQAASASGAAAQAALAPVTPQGDVGPREVAMGLAGVLVVRPADFATTATVFGGANQTPPNAFDDEAALLLTDVDPAFAAAPDTYDLRKFNGTLRLINGKAYPST